MDKNNLIERSSSQIIHRGDYINLRKDSLTKNGNIIAERDVVEHVGSIVAVPYEIINGEIYFYLVKQWRNPVEEWLIEFPAGTLNENPDIIKISENIISNCVESSKINFPPKASFSGIMSLKNVEPDNPYSWDIPINIIAELVALRIKYLNEISNEYLFLFKESIPIRGNDVSSNATHAVIISATDVNIIIPAREIINKVQNSERNFKVSLITSFPTVEIDNESNKTTILSSNEYLSTEIIFRIEILEISLIFITPENNNIVIINEANIPREAMSEDLNLLPNIRSDKSIIRENPTINNSGVISKIAGFSILIRILFESVNIEVYSNISLFIAIISSISMFYGNIMALRQNDLKRLFA